jgi:hypothetical protein
MTITRKEVSEIMTQEKKFPQIRTSISKARMIQDFGDLCTSVLSRVRFPEVK